MAINEKIVTGRKFRKCIDAVKKEWLCISFWTKASDVQFEDEQTAEEKLGDINTHISRLNQDLGGNTLSYNESEDAYYIQHGADSAPKKLGRVDGSVWRTTNYLGNISNSSRTLNIQAMVKEWQSLTVDNFILADIKFSARGYRNTNGQTNASCSISPTLSYDSTTGIITVTETQNSVGSSETGSATATLSSGKIYLLY